MKKAITYLERISNADYTVDYSDAEYACKVSFNEGIDTAVGSLGKRIEESAIDNTSKLTLMQYMRDLKKLKQ